MGKYIEEQKFNQWWLKLILWGACAGMMARLIYQWVEENEFNPSMLFAFLAVAVVSFLFLFLCLRTEIDEERIMIHFTLIPFSKRVIRWDEVLEAELRKYHAVMEFGGWGIRWSFGNGMAYNVSGDSGLQLKLKSGKKILIGTNQAIKLKGFLSELKRRHEMAAIKE